MTSTERFTRNRLNEMGAVNDARLLFAAEDFIWSTLLGQAPEDKDRVADQIEEVIRSAAASSDACVDYTHHQQIPALRRFAHEMMRVHAERDMAVSTRASAAPATERPAPAFQISTDTYALLETEDVERALTQFRWDALESVQETGRRLGFPLRTMSKGQYLAAIKAEAEATLNSGGLTDHYYRDYAHGLLLIAARIPGQTPVIGL